MSLFFSVQAAFSPRCSPISSPTKPPGSPNNLNFQSSTSLSSFVNKALNLTNTPVPKPLTATSTPHYTALDTPKIFSIRPHGSSRPVVGIHRHISSSPPVPCNHDTVRHVTSEGHVNPAAVSHHSTDTTPIGSRLDRDVERGSGDFNHTRPSRSLFSAFRCMSVLVSNVFSFHCLILIPAILPFVSRLLYIAIYFVISLFVACVPPLSPLLFSLSTGIDFAYPTFGGAPVKHTHS